MKSQKTLSLLTSISLALLLGTNFSCSPDEESEHNTWSHYGGSPDQSKYFEAEQITKENVKQLEIAWNYPTEDNSFSSFSPIIVDTIMYVYGKNNSLIALNAETGREIWIHTDLRGLSRRGINYWESPDKSDKRLVFTLNNSLQEIDALTGQSITDFGTGGYVDLRVGLDRDPTSIRRMQSMMPGVIFGDLVIVGSAPGESFFSPPGYVRAYNVLTGKLEWTFHTIPQPGEFGYDTWPKDAYKYVGAVNVWSEMTVDEERGIVFLPVGSPTYDFYGADREGAGLFGNSLVALDAKTGKRIWHYQTVHHDLWDYDLASAPQLLTINKDGKEIDVVAVATKHGFVFVFDRDTGEPVFPIEERPFPKSEMPGEKSWATQPIPAVIPDFTRHEVTKETLNPYFSDEVKEQWYQRLDTAKSGLYIPPSDKYETITMPGALGGASYGNTGTNPEKGIMYIMAQDYASIYKLSKVVPVEPVLSDDEKNKISTLYEGSCQTCHGEGMKGSGAGPSLINVGSRYSYDEFKTLLSEGRGRMPAFVHIEEATILAMHRYLGGSPSRFRGMMNASEAPEITGPVVASGGAKIPEDTTRAAPLEDYPADVVHPEDRYTTSYGTEWQALTAPPWASIFAYDLNNGTVKWRQPIGLDSAFSKGDKTTGAPSGTIRKGMVITSTDIVFATGKGGIVYAFDADNGKILWETTLDNESTGQPGMYVVNGKQYLVINASNRFDPSSYDFSKRPGALPKGYVVYSLPD
ncbi:PQQ-binding-like beta-propeller repeat protein [Algoriphagus halophytocola]|uniref:PQQ-binding-like beta-propeller repeat protein n=1 Tax=Algoriphagus halophytocola TaxID=2991499 RepID=A0ABY6MP29_9BACT|nr:MULTISPECIES: PQQ-binding-like beta-propeller repeat protein [unclassified Algoriphagus]UZD24086.1 PQQ-binding-like beta-propeller repeat protein [Algoriphagus sp. TR-M5]WBL41457.1 PQQ-binding-like beta-propeller repeat protein [Algoriphagus sp. TR-M9]